MQIVEYDIEHLVEYARNPRKNDHVVDSLAAGIREFGFRVPIVAKSDGTIIDGHLRLKAAKKLKMKTVPVLLADDLSDTQVKAFRIAVNRLGEMADWDFDLLKLELTDLIDADFDLDFLKLDELLIEEIKDEKGEETEENYSRKIESPIYKPTGPKPSLEMLVDTSKLRELVKDINAAKIDDDEKEFLRLAAYRHCVFDYRNIAEYYAHSSKEVQILFEDSALVIIDFDKAIDLGFVKVTKELSDAGLNEREGEDG